MSLPADTPRRIDPEKTLEAISVWIEQKVVEERAPGLIVGISGTDSALTFLACARAMERQGHPAKVLALNFQHVSAPGMTGEFNWMATDMMPWLKRQAPHAQFEIDDTIPENDDNKRWGHLFSRAVRNVGARQNLAGHYFPVGTRNATEQELGTYSQLSKSVSLLPIIGLYKSEVLEICAHLGMPKIALQKSCEVDCACGRFDVQANHMRELDLYIMCKQGLLSREGLEREVPANILTKVRMFHFEETINNDYRPRTPYLPPQNLVVTI